MGQIINGKEVAFKLKESIKEFVNERREKNLRSKSIGWPALKNRPKKRSEKKRRRPCWDILRDCDMRKFQNYLIVCHISYIIM